MFKKALKRLIGFYFIINPFLRYKIKNCLTIYNFHDVSYNRTDFLTKNNLIVSPIIFQKQIQWIKKLHNIIPPNSDINSQYFNNYNAMITFDDGYYGTFENGLRILSDLKVPSIIFLNMNNILTKKPLIPAITEYLEKNDINYKEFLKHNNIKSPSYLNIKPQNLKKFQNKSEKINLKNVNIFQGKLANISQLKKWEHQANVFYGNHLYEHWNAICLNSKQLESQFLKNKNALDQFINSVNFVAFPNGKFGTCFGYKEISILEKYFPLKYFSANSIKNNKPNQKIFGRLTLIETDTSILDFWYRIGVFYSR